MSASTSPVMSDDDDDEDTRGVGVGLDDVGALERLRAAHIRSKSATSKSVVRACEAIEETLKSNKMEIHPTSVFAATFAALESATGACEGRGNAPLGTG